MRNNGQNPEGQDGWGSHEEFLELCALSTSGELTVDERVYLQAHLTVCPDCQQAFKEFEAAASIGVPLLHAHLAIRDSAEPSVAVEELPGAGSLPTAPHIRRTPRKELQRNTGLAFPQGNGRRQSQVNWNYVWMPFAAAVLLTVTLGIYSYQLGKHGGRGAAQAVPSTLDATPGAKVEALEQQLSDIGHERKILQGQLAQREAMIAEFRRQVAQQSAALSEMKSAQAALEQTVEKDQADKQQVAQSSSSLAQKLDAAEASLQKTQSALDSLGQQRSEDQSRSESLEAQIRDLHGQLRDQEQELGKQQELLAHDRDIRDLMGARDLYIAEVYDVARDGQTQKPYGRVFYTKGKSLVFYAYDLDKEPGVHNASTFQAWGRGGPDRQQVLSLGVFYQDNLAKKRWVVKFDDARTLEQLDAVFVTVEPNGGSHRPSGKPLLFASLKIEPNHP